MPRDCLDEQPFEDSEHRAPWWEIIATIVFNDAIFILLL